MKNVTQLVGLIVRGPSRSLLERLLFWHPLKKITLDGEKWSVMTRREWAVEAGLTVHQYDRAQSLLRKRGLLVAQRAYYKGQQSVFLRLTDAALDEVRICKNADTVPERICRIADTINRRKQGRTGENKNCAASVAALSENDMVKSVKVVGKTASDVVKGYATMSPMLHKPDSLAGLMAAWRSGQTGYVPPLTLKKAGMLKNFRAACPPGTAEAVIATVVTDWLSFTSAAKTDGGAFNVPALPDIGFLLKYVGIAVNMHQSKTKPKKAKVEMVQTSVQLTAPVHEEASDKADTASVMTILGDD